MSVDEANLATWEAHLSSSKSVRKRKIWSKGPIDRFVKNIKSNPEIAKVNLLKPILSLLLKARIEKKKIKTTQRITMFKNKMKPGKTVNLKMRTVQSWQNTIKWYKKIKTYQSILILAIKAKKTIARNKKIKSKWALLIFSKSMLSLWFYLKSDKINQYLFAVNI